MTGHFAFPFLWSSLFLIRKRIYSYWHCLKWKLSVWFAYLCFLFVCLWVFFVYFCFVIAIDFWHTFNHVGEKNFWKINWLPQEKFWRLCYLIYPRIIYLQNKSGVKWKKKTKKKTTSATWSSYFSHLESSPYNHLEILDPATGAVYTETQEL